MTDFFLIWEFSFHQPVNCNEKAKIFAKIAELFLAMFATIFPNRGNREHDPILTFDSFWQGFF